MCTVVSAILFVAATTAVVAAIFGSIALQSLAPVGDGITTPLEQECMDVARQGYAIHSAYPDMTLEEIPVDDARLLLKLDDTWMNKCVTMLPPSIIFEIADGVERDFSSRVE